MASKLVEAREKLGEKQKLVEKVLDQAGDDYDFSKVTALGEDLMDTQAKVEKFRALNKELGDLTETCKKLEFDEYADAARKVREEMDRPVNKPTQPEGDGSGMEGKSIGQMFIESAEYKAYKADRVPGTAIFEGMGVKTLMTTSAGWAPESTRIGRVVEDVTRPVQILDIIPQGNTSQASVVYMEETTRTHNAAEKDEGAAYAESEFALTERSSQVRKITDSLPVTDEQLEDEEQVRAYIDARLRFGLRQHLDSQILNGSGTAPALEGILNVTGIQTQALGTDPRFDAIHKAITKIRVTGRAFPNAVVLHSNDWQEFRLSRTADGIYILGNPSQPGPMSLFGLPVALNEAISEGTGLVGDFQNFIQLWERRGVELQVGYTGTQFVEGEQTLRADLRVALTVYRPTAFCTVTGI